MDLIQECRTSGLSDKDWCEQHGIPVSSFYNKISGFRKKACDLPRTQKSVIHNPQQVVPLEITEEPVRCNAQAKAGYTTVDPAMFLDIYGCRIGITNHAAKETIVNLLSALQSLR